MSMSQIQAENERRAILKLLAATSDLSALDYELRQALEASEGIRTSFDKFITELEWLQEQNLITLEGTAVNTVGITQRGLDVAEYKLNLTGIAKKRPEL